MTQNTDNQCSQDERPPVEEDETQVIRSAELYDDFDLLRSVEVRVEICCVQPEGVPDH